MTLSLPKVSPRTGYVEEVYGRLLDAISTGALAPGERLTQEEIAEQLNVSRSPVLQALRMLRKDGLAEEAPGRGLVVARLDPVRIGHLYEVRGALDALAARLAAQRGAQIPQALIDRGREAAAGHDVAALIEADMAFHRAVHEASGNPMLAEMSQVHWIHLKRVMGAVLQNQAGRSEIWDEHAAIREAIVCGDADGAAACSLVHAQAARDSLGRSLVSESVAPRRAGDQGRDADPPAQPGVAA